VPEVFIVDLPEDPTQPGDGPLAGTATTRPLPPRGASQRRLTFTADREHPGLRGPRHWLRCSPDGSQIGFFMADPQGVPQFWTVSPNGGAPRQVTRNPSPAASAFTWSPNGRFVTFVVDGSVTATEVATGVTHRLTPRVEGLSAPRPEACVFSPDGRSIAHVRRVAEGGVESNQIFIATLPKELD
jgi:Tol biopolymer transport system component